MHVNQLHNEQLTMHLLLQVSHNDVHHAVLPSALHQPQPAAAPGIDAAVAVKQQEPFVVPDPNDSGSSLTGNATSTAASPSGFIVAYQSLARGEMSFGSPTSRRTAAVDQPMHQISSGLPPEQADEQTLALLHEVSQPLLPEPLPGSTSTTFCTQPVVKLVSNFIRPVQPESCSTHLSSKKARKPGGYTFCGKPNRIASWLSNLVEHVPGLPIPESLLWAMGSGAHIHSAVRLAGLQPLGE